MKKVKVMWFSRHEMTAQQKQALNASITAKFGQCDIETTQVNGTAANVHVAFNASNTPEGTPQELKPHKPLKELVKEFDIVAAVLPVNLQEQILPFMGNIPLLTATNNRQNNADGTATFVFEKWVRVLAVKIETEDF